MHRSAFGEARSKRAWMGLISIVFIMSALVGCSNKSSGSSAGSSGAPFTRPAAATDAKKVGDGLTRLSDSISKPQAAFHFSYQSRENLNPKFPSQAGSKPEVGTVEVEADIAPDQIAVSETRGGKRTETKANKSDPMFEMAKLPVLGSLLGPTFPLAFAGPTARFAGSDTVGGVVADKYDMDTTTADATTQAGIAMAGAMLGGKVKINSVKGSAWLDKSSGRLVKFTVDTDLRTQDGQSWQEHYQAVVTPK